MYRTYNPLISRNPQPMLGEANPVDIQTGQICTPLWVFILGLLASFGLGYSIAAYRRLSDEAEYLQQLKKDFLAEQYPTRYGKNRF